MKIMPSFEYMLAEIREWIPSVATLLAAFFGAWFAYLLQGKARTRDTLAAQISAANRAIFTIAQMLTRLKIFQIDYIDPNRKDPGIAFSMLPLFNEIEDNLQFDLANISYLLDSADSQIMMDLFILQKRYDESIELINYRSGLHRDMQHILEKKGFASGVEYSLDEFKNAIGVLNYTKIEEATKHLVYNVDRTISSLEETKSHLLSLVSQR